MAQFIFTSEKEKKKLNELKEYAFKNPIDLRNGIPENYASVGDIEEHVYINGNIKIVYSIEIQPKLGKCHHLSISKENREYPSPYIVDLFMEDLGLGSLNDHLPREMWIENGYAINILQPVNQK